MSEFNHYFQVPKSYDIKSDEGKKTQNVGKNRRGSGSPYDHTRVILKNSASGDYINANFLKMKVSGKLEYNYIATQAPLDNTTQDFWLMVKQQSCHLIVMLTNLKDENDQDKCYKYWPNIGEVMNCNESFSIKTTREGEGPEGSYVWRNIILHDQKTNEELVHYQ